MSNFITRRATFKAVPALLLSSPMALSAERDDSELLALGAELEALQPVLRANEAVVHEHCCRADDWLASKGWPRFHYGDEANDERLKATDWGKFLPEVKAAEEAVGAQPVWDAQNAADQEQDRICRAIFEAEAHTMQGLLVKVKAAEECYRPEGFEVGEPQAYSSDLNWDVGAVASVFEAVRKLAGGIDV